jgi:hypothetical protein
MLTVNEFSVGNIGAIKPISLVLPRDEQETEMLIVGTLETPIAMILDGAHSFKWFESTGNTHWTGLIIPNLRVELDEKSASAGPMALGAAMRQGSELAICGKRDGSNGTTFVSMLSGLPLLDHKVGFSRWQLVIGEGLEKRVIRKFDVSPAS